MRKFFAIIFSVVLFVSMLPSSTSANDDTTEKLLSMGFSESAILEMDNIKKDVFLRLYDKYDGTAKLLPKTSEESSIFSAENDIDVYIVGGNVGQSSPGYKFKGLSIVGGISKNILEKGTIKTVAAAAAWSDNWNFVDHDAQVEYGDFWGSPVTKNMTLIDASPKVGLSYKFSSVPSHLNNIYTTLSVTLRRADGDSGTTDAVGKIGYTEESVNISASFSANPSVTFTPTEKVYQKAHTTSFYY